MPEASSMIGLLTTCWLHLSVRETANGHWAELDIDLKYVLYMADDWRGSKSEIYISNFPNLTFFLSYFLAAVFLQFYWTFWSR